MPTSDERFDRLCARVRRRLKGARVPGAAIGVFADGEERVAGFGVTSIEQPAHVTPRTLFQIGSISKTYTATLAARLAQEGLLDLDAPIRTYIPRLRLADRHAATGVTMRHLFTHSAGFEGDYFQGFGSGDDALAKYVATLHTLRQITPLGAFYGYCNAGFVLAGRVIEVVTGQTFEDAMRQRIFEPLELTESFYLPEDAISRSHAVGHAVVEDEIQVARPWYIGRYAGAAGGIVSNVGDLLRWARFHLGDPAMKGRRVLRAAELRALRKPALRAGPESSIGIGWHVSKHEGLTVAQHGGGTNGQLSQLWLCPERNLAASVVTNSGGGGAIIGLVGAYLTEHYLGVPQPPAPRVLELGVEDLEQYTGRYETSMSCVDVTLSGGTLNHQLIPLKSFPRWEDPPGPPGPLVPLTFHAPDLGVVDDGPWKGASSEFLRDGRGQVCWLRLGSRVYARR